MPHPAADALPLLDQVPVGLFAVRADLTVRFWNHTLESWTRIPRSDVVGHFVGDRFPPLVAPDTLRRIHRVARAAAGEACAETVVLALPNLPSPEVTFQLTRLEDAGEPLVLFTLPARGTVDATPAPEPAEDPTIQAIRERLLELGMLDDPEVTSAVLDDFLTAAVALGADLQDAVTRWSPPEIRTLAHRLLGAALSIGAERLGGLAQDLERHAGASRGEETMEAHRLVQDELVRVVRMGHRFLEQTIRPTS